MDGGAYPRLSYRSNSTKRPFTMPEHNRAGSPSSLFIPETAEHAHDDHYENGHDARRRRLRLPTPATSRTHFPGDGLDFRRPVMSVGGGGGIEDWEGAGRAEEGRQQRQPETIDLTDDVGEAQDMGGHGMTYTHPPAGDNMAPAEATAGSSRAQRLPRFERNVIIISDSDEEEDPQQPPPAPAEQQRGLHYPLEAHGFPRRRHRATHVRSNSPAEDMDDIEFVASRPVSRTHNRHHAPAVPGTRSVTPFPNEIDISDLDDDLVLLEARARPVGINADGPGLAPGVGTRDAPDLRRGVAGALDWLHHRNAVPRHGRLAARLNEAQRDDVIDLDDFIARRHPHDAYQEQTQAALDDARRQREVLEDQMARLRAMRTQVRDHQRNHAQHHQIHAHGHVGHPHAMMLLPGGMDYGIAGFDMGYGGNENNRQKTPEYEPLPAPEEGFTRSPEENEVVVCPNCGDELGVTGNEVKQQVWVNKNCGHAYCGECTTHRLRTVNKKGKGRAVDTSLPPPWKRCVVDGCDKSASKSAMVHVYMSS